ncbi:kinase-like domain-containing protein [Rhizophagus irregularis DAOM 181602=DAOM 197198]|nr:kinase-like domain-containing protein [Rhizophagus irregularis DAOM 181602=DAOM 197198]
MKVIRNTFGSWAFRGKNKAEFDQAEAKRKKLIELKIGHEFAEKYHSEAIYTSRLLSDIISKCSFINSFSTISCGNKQTELELDIDTESLSSQNLSIKTQELNLETDDDNVGKRIKTR